MKRQIRQQMREHLSGQDGMTRYARSLAACKHLIMTGEFTQADVVMIFLSMADEVDTAAIALAAWQRGKTVVAPRVSWEHHRILPVEIRSLETDMATTRYGLNEPTAGTPVPSDMIDLIVVPALAFDRTGRRLGRGAGFYDRFLSQQECKAVKCGLAFHEQLVQELPGDVHDCPVDMVVTDEEVLHFNHKL